MYLKFRKMFLEIISKNLWILKYKNINTCRVPALKKQNISEFVSKFVAKLLKNRILFKGILIFVSNNSGNNYIVAMVSPNLSLKSKEQFYQ